MTVNDAWGAVAELAASQHGVFNRSQAAELKLSNKRLRGLEAQGTIRRVNRDLFVVTAAPISWHQGLWVANLASLVISHRSAAELHKFDGFSPTGSPVIHSSVAGQAHHKRFDLGCGSLTIHEIAALRPDMTTVVDKIRVTNVAMTLAMLGSVLAGDQLEKALDSAIRRGASERWITESAIGFRAFGIHGSRALVCVLSRPDRSGASPDSWFERKLSRTLRAAGLPPLQLQHQLGRCRIDGAWPEVKLGIEAHSREFHFGRQAEVNDQRRDLEAATQGWELLYVTWAMLEEPSLLADRVRAIYNARCELFGVKPLSPG